MILFVLPLLLLLQAARQLPDELLDGTNVSTMTSQLLTACAEELKLHTRIRLLMVRAARPALPCAVPALPQNKITLC